MTKPLLDAEPGLNAEPSDPPAGHIGNEDTPLMAEAPPMATADDPIRLREFTPDDTALVATVIGDPLIPLITSLPPDADAAAIEAYIERQRNRSRSGEGFQFVIVDNDSDRAVGQIGLTFRDQYKERASLGYWITPAERGNGHASAALRAITRWGLQELAIERLELYVEPWNEGSWRAAEAAGYSREGLLKSWERVGDTRRDMYMYSRVAPPISRRVRAEAMGDSTI